MTESGRGLGESARDLVRQLAEKAGLDELKEGLAAVEQAARATRGADADVWTAIPLTEGERGTLEGRLKGRFGEDVVFHYHVEPAILGGVVVRVGDRYLDGSVATKLGQLRHDLLGGGAG